MSRILPSRSPLFVLVFVVLLTAIAVAQSAQPPASASQAALGLQLLPNRTTFIFPDGSKSPELTEGAVVIDYALPGSPAQTAGVKNGDIMLAINGHRTCDANQVPQMLQSAKPGEDAELFLFRDGRLLTVKFRLANWAELYPNGAVTQPLAKEINTALAYNNLKGAREMCKRMPDDVMIESSTGCLAALRARYDYKEIRRVREALAMRCLNCMLSVFAATWDKAPNTTEGIQANLAFTKQMAQLGQTQQSLFRKMDQDLADSLKGMEPASALAKYTQTAGFEGSCRDVPPSPVLVQWAAQYAKQNNLGIPDEARAKAAEAQRMANRAHDDTMRFASARLWNAALWFAPWWSEPYVKSSELLDKLGRPQQAAEISKLGLMLPTAASSTSPSVSSTAGPTDTEPATEQSLLKCAGSLDATEKGGDAERRTRERCARIAGKLDKRPDVPEEARRRFARGEAALELGQSPAEFVDAANEFEASLRLAPWWTEAHCNLGQAYEKAVRFQDAIQAYKACVAAGPNAPNLQDTQKRIYKLEYAADREQKQAISSQMQQREAALRFQSMPGVWINASSGELYNGIIRDGMFVATRTPPSPRGVRYIGDFVLKGTVTGDKIEGSFTTPPLYTSVNGCTTPTSEMPMSGTISADGKSMNVKYQVTNFEPHGIRGTLLTEPKCTMVTNVGTQTVVMVLQKQE